MSKRELSNRKVLVVEDEMMIAMLIEDMLDELGCKVVGPATNVPRALELIGKESIDVAVLVFQAKFHCQFARPRLFRHPGVGAAFNDETLTVNGFDDTAQPP